MSLAINRVDLTIGETDHPYLTGPWQPADTEWDAPDCTVIGTVPEDLDGVYIRNGQNPMVLPKGRYHLFDGDGMLHATSFKAGTVVYRNRWIRTRGLQAELDAGRPLWGGLIDGARESEQPGWGAHGKIKDNSGTDVVLHNGRALTMWYQCGEVYRLDARTLEQQGADSFAGKFPAEGVSAHSHVDETTGDFLFFNYGTTWPYMHYGVVDKDDNLVHYTPVELPGARLPHDMAFTENYSILMDLPLFWDEELLRQGKHSVKFHRDIPSRFGVIPRFGSNQDIRWFEADPTYVYHSANAYEDGNEIVMDACVTLNPQPETPAYAKSAYGRMMAYLDPHLLGFHQAQWRFNTDTGMTKFELLDGDLVTEFCKSNESMGGRKTRYTYNMLMTDRLVASDGLVKYDNLTGKREIYRYGEGRFGSESPFAPRVGSTGEDDGYVLTYVTDVAADQSECLVFDAQRITDGPVATVILPHRIAGTSHSTWAPGHLISSPALV